MDTRIIDDIITLADKRIGFFAHDREAHPWYRGSITHYDGILDEMEEVRAEMRDANHVYLEDELGDIFWNYLCMLEGLRQEGRIRDIESVFDRCYKKLSERIGPEGDGGQAWDEVKQKQKEELKQEHQTYYL